MIVNIWRIQGFKHQGGAQHYQCETAMGDNYTEEDIRELYALRGVRVDKVTLISSVELKKST